MSPQHIDKKIQKERVEPTLKDDIFAFGATVYRMLANDIPFRYEKEIKKYGLGN